MSNHGMFAAHKLLKHEYRMSASWQNDKYNHDINVTLNRNDKV